MIYEPKPYFESAMEKLLSKNRCLLFADVGLGKTSMILSALVRRAAIGQQVFPALVVSTNRVGTHVWGQEIKKWDHLSHLRYNQIIGTPTKRIELLHKSADVYFISFSLALWLSKIPGILKFFKTVIVDESSKLGPNRCSVNENNPKQVRLAGTEQCKGIAKFVLATNYFIGATGTPASNSLAQIWGQAWYCDLGKALGRTFSIFQERYMKPKYFGSMAWMMIQGCDTEIYERIEPFTVNIMAKDWLDLKEIRYIERPVSMSPVELAGYKRLKTDLTIQMEEHEEEFKNNFVFNSMALSQKLLQYASGYVYPDNNEEIGIEAEVRQIHNAKQDELIELIDEINKPVIVVYFYKETLKRLSTIPGFKAIDAKNDEIINQWNRLEIPVLGLHWMAAHGLNLQFGGCDIIFYDLQWSAELFIQAVNRIGPARQLAAGLDRVVTCYSIVTKDTVDETIYEVLHGKMAVETAFRRLWD